MGEEREAGAGYERPYRHLVSIQGVCRGRFLSLEMVKSDFQRSCHSQPSLIPLSDLFPAVLLCGWGRINWCVLFPVFCLPPQGCHILSFLWEFLEDRDYSKAIWRQQLFLLCRKPELTEEAMAWGEEEEPWRAKRKKRFPQTCEELEMRSCVARDLALLWPCQVGQGTKRCQMDLRGLNPTCCGSSTGRALSTPQAWPRSRGAGRTLGPGIGKCGQSLKTKHQGSPIATPPQHLRTKSPQPWKEALIMLEMEFSADLMGDDNINSNNDHTTMVSEPSLCDQTLLWTFSCRTLFNPQNNPVMWAPLLSL